VKNDRGVEAVDLIAHSMGGLVARCYIEAADFASVIGESDFPDYGTLYRCDVRRLITLAAPHHGAEFAAIGPWLGPLFPQLTPGERPSHASQQTERGRNPARTRCPLRLPRRPDMPRLRA